MDSKIVRAISAFAVAPLVPSLVFAALCQSREAFRFAVTIAYPVALGIGLPAYVLIQKHAELTRRRVLRVSGWTGFATGVIALQPLWAILLGVPLGLSAGLTFWLVWHRRSGARART